MACSTTQSAIWHKKPFSAPLLPGPETGSMEVVWNPGPPTVAGDGQWVPFPICAGAHLNPAVTFAMCFLAREPWIKLPIYTLAQTLGAFLGAGIVFGLYYGKHCPPPLPAPSAGDLLASGLPMADRWGLPRPPAHDSLIHAQAPGAGHRGNKRVGQQQALTPPASPPPAPEQTAVVLLTRDPWEGGPGPLPSPTRGFICPQMPSGPLPTTSL